MAKFFLGLWCDLQPEGTSWGLCLPAGGYGVGRAIYVSREGELKSGKQSDLLRAHCEAACGSWTGVPSRCPLSEALTAAGTWERTFSNSQSSLEAPFR